jgi:hypothetical protein
MRWNTYARRFMTLQEKFDDLYVVSPDSCWIWAGTTGDDNYGRMSVNGKSVPAHRVSYELHVGPIPEGLEIDHLCRVRNCVNWRHLEPVTRLENQHRSPLTMKGKTHCKKGHPFSGYNLMFSTNGQRMCRVCRRAVMRQRKLRRGIVKNPRGPYSGKDGGVTSLGPK